MAIYKISPTAEQDLIGIYIRGFREWGDKKADDFQIQLISSFQMLADNPDMGRAVAVRPQLQRHELNPYVIFYRKFSYGVRVARVLYKNRAMEKYL
ncbi:MAG: type II toxin-antitoxin system RelE/ParE family toxin [Xanthomonadales bacterium]|nr:type II toxin-antitoxin system RelE/ParE family toxin [Xanthomonadales bacterium]